MGFPMMLGGSGDDMPTINFIVSTNQTDFNLLDAVEAVHGTISVATRVTCYVNAGVKIGGGAPVGCIRAAGALGTLAYGRDRVFRFDEANRGSDDHGLLVAERGEESDRHRGHRRVGLISVSNNYLYNRLLFC